MFLPPGGDDDVLLAPGDEEEAVLVEEAQVAGVQPIVLQRLAGGGLVLVVAAEDVGALDQHLAVVADLDLHPHHGLAHRAEPELVAGRTVHGGAGGGLGHPVALHHRHAAGVEELEDLGRDRGGAGHRLADVRPEQPAHVLVQRLFGLVEPRLQLGRHLPAGLPQLAHLHSHLHRLAQLLLVGSVRGGERVDLLEHPRHGREVARAHLHQVGNDLLRVARPVGDRRAELEGRELDQDRECVGQGQEEIGAVALFDHALGHHGIGDRPVVPVREQAALGRAGGARGVDVERDVLGADRLVAGAPLVVAVTAAALAKLLERERAAQLGVAGLHDDHVLQVGAVVLDLADLGQLLAVLDEDRARVGVLEHVLALRGRVGLVDRDQGAARGEDAEAGVGPLGPRVGEDGDLVARLQAEVHEPERDLLDRLPELGVGDVRPLLARLVPLRGRVAVLLHRERQQVGDRLATGAGGGPSAGGDCFHGAFSLSDARIPAEPVRVRGV